MLQSIVSDAASLDEKGNTDSVMREETDPVDSVITVVDGWLDGVTGSVVVVEEDAVVHNAFTGAVAEGDEEAVDAEAAAEAWAA